MIVTRGLGARGVLPTAGLGFTDFGLVVVVAVPQPTGGWETNYKFEVRRDDDADVIAVIVAFLNAI